MHERHYNWEVFDATSFRTEKSKPGSIFIIWRRKERKGNSESGEKTNNLEERDKKQDNQPAFFHVMM
eukprot:9817656-Ditylum_brightwellii.AAC.1